jgi:hypothetical protein
MKESSVEAKERSIFKINMREIVFIFYNRVMSSRTNIYDKLECCMNLIAMDSHIMELVNSIQLEE